MAFDTIQDLIAKRVNMPRHVGFTIAGNIKWVEKKKGTPKEAYRACFSVIRNLLKLQIKLNIPILTFLLVPKEFIKHESFAAFSREAISFFKDMPEMLFENQMKVSFLGKWYDLPEELVEVIKRAMSSTKDYDRFFLNFCVNYDGQDEIVDAVRLVFKKSLAEKREEITKETIKENLASSYFLPPDLIIVTGGRKQLDGFLLWDSQHSKIYFSEKLWPEFDKQEFLTAMAVLK